MKDMINLLEYAGWVILPFAVAILILMAQFHYQHIKNYLKNKNDEKAKDY